MERKITKNKEPPVLPLWQLKRNEYQPNVRFVTASGRITSVTPKSIKASPANKRKWELWFLKEFYEEALFRHDDWNLLFLKDSYEKKLKNSKWYWSNVEAGIFGDYLIRKTPSNSIYLWGENERASIEAT